MKNPEMFVFLCMCFIFSEKYTYFKKLLLIQRETMQSLLDTESHF